MKINVRKRGPIFDGRAAKAAHDFADESERRIANEGVNMVRTQLGQVLKHPTGYYESQIQTDRQFNDTLITDNDVVYGPWLEGTGSRNQSTRFKGYATFRKIKQRLEGESGSIAERVLPPYLRRMQ